MAREDRQDFRAPIVRLATLVGIFLGALATRVDAYPDRPLKLVVPFSSGDAADLSARTVADELSKDLGKPVTVVNRPGAGGILGAGEVARSAPDGYTLMLGSYGMMTAQPYMNAAAGYDYTKFRALAQISEVPLGISVRADSPHRDVRALLEAARLNPGKIRYTVPGLGTIQHVSMESFARREGLTLTVVAYKSGVEAVTGVLTGDADFVYVAASNYVGQDKLRVLAVTSASRLPEFPDAPTMAEAGRPLDAAVWFGIFAPAGIPDTVATRLETALAAAIKSASTRATLEKLKITPAYLDAAAFTRRVGQSAETNRALLKELGLGVK